MDALMALIADIKSAQAAGAPPAQLDAARACQRKAQFLLEFVEAENSTGFHAPQEAARILTLSVDASRKGEMVLRPVTPSPAATLARNVTP
jgi:nitrite reductase (cytochrome c-552)